MNAQTQEEHERECIVCGRSDRLVSENKCEVCDALEALSNDIIEKDFIVILSDKPAEKALILPGNYYMLMENREEVRTRMQTDGSYVRCYGKNRRFTGENLSAKLWIGDYSSAKEFTELASASRESNVSLYFEPMWTTWGRLLWLDLREKTPVFPERLLFPQAVRVF